MFILLLNKLEMAELENDVDVDNTDYEEVESYEDDTQDTQEDITYEQAMEYKKRLAKAEKKLVELKKQTKTQKKEETEVMTEKDITLREEVADFLLENKDLKEYKSEILKYRKQGFTMKQAVALVENDDVTIENRRKTQSMNITSWEESGKTTYDYKDLAKMSQSEYNRIKDLESKWKVVIKR